MNGCAALQRFEEVAARVRAAELRAGRNPGGVTILLASKGQSGETMRALAEGLAVRGVAAVFGESYVQEFEKKRAAFSDLKARVDFIGGLQRNKARAAASMFDVIQSVDSLKLAQALDRAAATLAKRQAVYVQVNVSNDPGKRGCPAAELEPLCRGIVKECPALKLCGVMTITRFYERADEARPDFRLTAELARRAEAAVGFGLEVSMGMSSDFEIAVEEGATVVRIGSAVFGGRPGGGWI